MKHSKGDGGGPAEPPGSLWRNPLSDTRALRLAPWIVVGVALLVRLLHVFQIDASPTFAFPVVDAKTYAEAARAYAAGDWLGPDEGPYWQAPLYPWFLGLVRAMSGDLFFYAARVAQAVLGAATCWLTWDVGRRVFGRGVGLGAALVVALYGPLVYFDAELLPAGFATFLLMWGVQLLLRARDGHPRRHLQAGVVLGLATLAVATTLTFLAAAVLWVAWSTRLTKERAAVDLRRAALVAAGAALVIAPVTLRNAVVGGDAVLISWNGGVNYWIGNNPDYEETVAVGPGWGWTDLVTEPDRAGIVRPSEKSRYFFAKARGWAAAEPVDWLALQLRKTVELWQGVEVGRNQPVYYWRSYSQVLSALVWVAGIAFPFGLLAPFALLGMAVGLRRPEVRLPLIFVVVFGASVIAFFPAARYRAPMIPVLALFGVWGGAWLVQRARARAVVQATAGGLAVLVLLFVLNAGARMDMEGGAELDYLLGDAHLRAGRLAEAQDAFVRVLEAEPDYHEARFSVGTIRGMSGDAVGAARILGEVARVEPARAEVWLNLAMAELELDRTDEAERSLERALALDPRNTDAWVQLLALHVRAGDLDAARSVLERVRVHLPADGARFDALFEELVARSGAATRS